MEMLIGGTWQPAASGTKTVILHGRPW